MERLQWRFTHLERRTDPPRQAKVADRVFADERNCALGVTTTNPAGSTGQLVVVRSGAAGQVGVGAAATAACAPAAAMPAAAADHEPGCWWIQRIPAAQRVQYPHPPPVVPCSWRSAAQAAFHPRAAAAWRVARPGNAGCHQIRRRPGLKLPCWRCIGMHGAWRVLGGSLHLLHGLMTQVRRHARCVEEPSARCRSVGGRLFPSQDAPGAIQGDEHSLVTATRAAAASRLSRGAAVPGDRLQHLQHAVHTGVDGLTNAERNNGSMNRVFPRAGS
jgi:hypothetical protein